MTFINNLPAEPDCGLAPQGRGGPPAMLHVQYFGHNAVTIKLATML
jgi:hypothetical protein